MFANFLNFVFNALLGRALSFEQFALLTFISTLGYFYNIFLNSVMVTTNHSLALLYSNSDSTLIAQTYKTIKNHILKITTVGTLIWFLLVPVLSSVFKINGYLVLASFAPIILTGSLVALTKGHLQGRFKFGLLAVVVVVEALLKLGIAFGFIVTGNNEYAYLSIPLAICLTFVFALFFSEPVSKIAQTTNLPNFPKNFFLASFLTTIAGAAFLSLDVFFSKIYLSPVEAGKYALLSLAGKMIYFFGSILNGFLITYTAKYVGQKGDDKTTFYKIFFASFLITLGAYLVIGVFGSTTLPFLLGEKANSITNYLPVYGFALALFTLAGTVSSYHLALKRYVFSRIGLVASSLLIAGLIIFHQNINQFNYVVLAVSSIYFSLLLLLHLYFTHWKKTIVTGYSQDILPEYKKQLPIKVGICLPAYNEENNIEKLLHSLVAQKTEYFEIAQITVVSSSTDSTDDIVTKFRQTDARVSLIREPARKGKAAAINMFLQQCDTPIVVLQSTDTVCHHDTVEHLCTPFIKDLQTGMTGGAPIPLNDKNTFLGFVVHTWWWFHRHIPRFGEIIAFRNILPQISEETAVDEAYIQAKFVQLGYKVVHIDEAVVFNKGAETLSDMIKQRRRIHNGHARLHNDENVKIDHVTKNMLWLMLFKYEFKNIKEFFWLVGGIFIEIYARILGKWDMHISKKNPYIWDIATSTKELHERV